MRRRGLVIGGVLAAAAASIGGVAAWRAIPYSPPAHQDRRPASVARELAYVERYWQDHDREYGDLGGTDCVNFTSQALLARGWTMTGEWGTSVTLWRRASTATWVSSTAMMHWFERSPDLVRPVSGDEVQPGDIAQFDWDDSGDRDHTAVVSRVVQTADGPRIDVAEHSPDGLHDSVGARLAEHPGTARVYYWHPLH